MKYRTIVVDPPWVYDEGWPGNGWAGDQARRAALPYPAMSLATIAALPVGEMAQSDAHLFLWTTNRYLLDAYAIAESWGFRPSQLLTWCKPPAGIGPGGLFAQTTEFVVYARRGKPEQTHRQPSSWVEFPRYGHSVKPEAFLDLIERAVPGPYLEMFARRNRLGWDTWGDECFQHVELSS